MPPQPESIPEREPGYCLTLEASGREARIALGCGDELLEEQALRRSVRHNLELLPAVDALCRRHGVPPAALAEIYVSTGPGSFTGLRCAMAAARMFAHTLGARLVALPTAAVLAQAVPAADPAVSLAVMQASKRGTLFVTFFDVRDGAWHPRGPGRIEETASLLAGLAKPTWLLAEASIDLGAARDAADPGLRWLEAAYQSPTAAAAFALGRRCARQQRWTNPLELVPLYPREPEAALLWQERHA